jgi:hypothetical protein
MPKLYAYEMIETSRSIGAYPLLLYCTSELSLPSSRALGMGQKISFHYHKAGLIDPPASAVDHIKSGLHSTHAPNRSANHEHQESS